MLEAKRKSRLLEWSSLLICVLLIAAVSLSGVLNRPKIWPDVQLEYTDGKKAFSVQDGDAYGVIANGPYYDLPVGTYRIKWQMHADGDNEIRLSSSNDARIVPSVIHTTAGKWEDEAYFEILDPTHSFSINLEFTSGTRIEPINFRLYSPEYTDHAWTFAFALLAVWGLFVLVRRGMLTRENCTAILMIGLAVLVASAPLLQDDKLHAHDLQYHAARIMNLADAISKGQLHAYVGGFSYNGYGAATSVFYPDLFLYPAAWMILADASMSYVLNVYTIAVNVLTGLLMYYAAVRLLGSKSAAVCAAILYVLASYRLSDTYVRYMLGEMLAMAFIPVFLLGMYEIVCGDEKRWPLLVLSATAIFRSHMVGTILAACAAVCICLLYVKILIKEKIRILTLVKACVVTALVNMSVLVPFLSLYMSGANTPVMQFGFENEALKVSYLLSYGGFMGISLMVSTVAFFCVLDFGAREERHLVWFAVGGCVLAMMTTRVMPWSYINQMTGDIAKVIQFPYRLMTWSSALLALCGGYGLVHFIKDVRQAMLLTLILAIVSSVPIMDKAQKAQTGIEFGRGANTYMNMPEYQIEGTDVNDTRSREPIILGDLELLAYEKDGTRVSAQVSTKQAGAVSLPLFGFDGYVVELNGERIDWRLGENNRLTVDVPAGTQGTLRVWYEVKMAWRIAETVSLLSAVGLLAFALLRRKGEFRPRNRK